jgi:hypothetical protein
MVNRKGIWSMTVKELMSYEMSISCKCMVSGTSREDEAVLDAIHDALVAKGGR